MIWSRPARRLVRPLASGLLVAALVATALPVPSMAVGAQDARPVPEPAGMDASSVLAADVSPGTPADVAPAPAGMDASLVTPADLAGISDTPGQHPSIAYEEAMAHANDKNAFQPGGRVDVGFTPRAADRWPVDGRVPTALPAGRATGRQMAASREGTTWADVSAPAPGPGTTPGAGTAAEPTAAPDPGATPDPDATPDPGTSPEPSAMPDPPPADPTASPEATSGPVDGPAGGSTIPATGASYTAPEPAPVIDPAAASGLTRQVFGFLPYWELSGASSKLNYDVLSTIGYFSVGADSKGNLRKKNSDGTTTTGWGGWTSSSLTSVINDAHAHGTRVVLTLSVFAWTTRRRPSRRPSWAPPRRASTSRSRPRPPSGTAVPTGSTLTSSPSRAPTRTSSWRCSRRSAPSSTRSAPATS